MARFGFIGPSYESESLSADAQKTSNWYTEILEDGTAKSQVALYPTPGTKQFSVPGGPSVRGSLEINGRCFVVSGTELTEILANGARNPISAVVDDGNPAYLAASATQLLVASGGQLIVYSLTGGGAQVVANDTTGVGLPAMSQVKYCDGFFIALQANSQKFWVSKALDATSWDPTSTEIISVFPDNIVGMEQDHRELAFFGRTKAVVYYDSGNLFPFDVVPGGYGEHGAASPWGITKADNSVFWLGRSINGAMKAFRAVGYTPTRISNHAIENAWASYATVEDVIAYSYQDRGHSFVVFYFPTGDATWVFDASTNQWHERTFLDPATGLTHAHRARTHVYAFGKHLVGDRSSGTLYELNVNFLDDFDNPIQRVRRSPYVNTEAEWMFHQRLQIDLEVGLGPIPPLGTPGVGTYGGPGAYGGPEPFGGVDISTPRDPQAMLRWSDDGARTWSNYHTASAGAGGAYKTRLLYRRLGRSRSRVYELSVTDPIPWRIIDGYLAAEPGYTPNERLVNQFRKIS